MYKKLFIIILILLILIVMTKKKNMEENFTENKITWNRNKCKYIIQENLQKVLDKYNIKNDKKNAKIYFPCTYDDTIKEINEMPDDAQYYFIIDNVDIIVAKNKLWDNIMKFHGLKKALTMAPMTYLLMTEKDKIKREFNKNKIYILKSNNQRQEGLKITNSLNDILNSDNHVIVQELLQNPYLISGRKINLRVYVLVICNINKIDIYVYDDGFIYYTKELYKENSLEFDTNITTGYIDREIYKNNPLTHKDLKKHLGNKQDVIFQRIYNLLQDVFEPYLDKICNGKLKNKISFQLFGADIALDKELQPKIMEINKGPDMDSKDERDGKVKIGCLTDILKTLKIIEDTENNGFIHILEYEKDMK